MSQSRLYLLAAMQVFDEPVAPQVVAPPANLAAASSGVGKWELNPELPPDISVLYDEVGRCFRAELSVFMQQSGLPQLKEVRVRGPPRDSVEKARKDGVMLKREVFRTAQQGPGLQSLRVKLRMLEACDYRPEDLVGEDVEPNVERLLPGVGATSQLQQLKDHERKVQKMDTGNWAQQRNVLIKGEWIFGTKEAPEASFSPVGPSWSMAAKTLATPHIPGVWYVHERQNQETGHHVAWLFFNASTGKYYRNQLETGMWVQTGTPHSPIAHPVTISHGSTCLPATGGRKDDLAVMLPELAKTGSALKQPLPFLDKPSALFFLVDGLRESNSAAQFCAQKFHTHFMPRLSSRATEWEDHELLSIVQESIEALDTTLLDSNARYSGCCFALAIVLGRRLVCATLGNCRVLICRPPPAAKPKAASSQSWLPRVLAGGAGGRTNDVMALEVRRRRLANAPLDLDSARVLSSVSASADLLAAASSDQERALLRVARAAHPFATLGLRPNEIQDGGIASVKKAIQDFEAVAHPGRVEASRRDIATSAFARITEAAQVVENMMGLDMYGTQLLAELFTMIDDENGIPSHARAAQVLGLEPGCSEAMAQLAVDTRYRTLLMQLAAASPAIAQWTAHGIRILEEVSEIATRPTMPWTPTDRAVVSVTRALGLRDLKKPRPLVGVEVATEVLHLEDGASCVTLLTDSARELSEARIGEVVGQHTGRPRAVCLRLAQEAQASCPGEAAGAVSMFINVAVDGEEEAKQPDAKKRRMLPSGVEVGRPARARIGHVLLRLDSPSALVDNHTRRAAPAGRTQADAEAELLQLLESLLKEDPKLLTRKFGEACREKSDCKSALTTPLGDMGWLNPGIWGKEFDAVAFDLEAGALSDVIVTPRGVHILHRLA